MVLFAFGSIKLTCACCIVVCVCSHFRSPQIQLPDSCIDAVGCEASGHGATGATIDRVKAAAFLATDRVRVLRQAIMCCRKSWYGLDSGRVRWSGRQDTALRGDEQRAYIQERTDPCSGLY